MPTTARSIPPSSATSRTCGGKAKARSASSTTQAMVRPTRHQDQLPDPGRCRQRRRRRFVDQLDQPQWGCRGAARAGSRATHYVVFDACRNELNLTQKDKRALTNRGFVPIAYTPGVMIAYATAPGKTATDQGRRRPTPRRWPTRSSSPASRP